MENIAGNVARLLMNHIPVPRAVKQAKLTLLFFLKRGVPHAAVAGY